jgi:hypothetical protein
VRWLLLAARVALWALVYLLALDILILIAGYRMLFGLAVLLVIAMVYFRVRPVYVNRPWSTWHEYPNRRRGATLASVVVAMGLIGLCLTAAMQAYVQGSRASLAQARRLASLAACQEQIERVRIGGGLPAGERAFSVPGHVPARGTLRVEPGPVSGTRQVTALARWEADDRLPAGQVMLVTIMAGGGGR